MDYLDIMVAVAHRRLTLRRFLVAIERNPKLLEPDNMATPKLQSLTKSMDQLEHNLEFGAGKLLDRINAVGARGEAAFSKGHQKVEGIASRVSEVESFVSALEGSNGGDPLDGSSNSSGGSAEKPRLPETPAPIGAGSNAEAGATEQTITAADVEQLTVNGVSKEA